MGIKNLMTIIKKYASSAINYTKIDKYKNKIIAIDTSIMINDLASIKSSYKKICIHFMNTHSGSTILVGIFYRNTLVFGVRILWCSKIITYCTTTA